MALGSPSRCTKISRCWSPPCCPARALYVTSQFHLDAHNHDWVGSGLAGLAGLRVWGKGSPGISQALLAPLRGPQWPQRAHTTLRMAHPKGPSLGAVEGAVAVPRLPALQPEPRSWVRESADTRFQWPREQASGTPKPRSPAPHFQCLF